MGTEKEQAALNGRSAGPTPTARSGSTSTSRTSSTASTSARSTTSACRSATGSRRTISGTGPALPPDPDAAADAEGALARDAARGPGGCGRWQGLEGPSATGGDRGAGVRPPPEKRNTSGPRSRTCLDTTSSRIATGSEGSDRAVRRFEGGPPPAAAPNADLLHPQGGWHDLRALPARDPTWSPGSPDDDYPEFDWMSQSSSSLGA
jgi:hypothetical protein